MRILFIRHADPDYVADGITDKGRIEAKLLADRIDTFGIDEVYVSPLGRARDTFAFCANKLDIKPVTLDWLEEFPARFDLLASAQVSDSANNADTDTVEDRKSVV